MEFLGIFVEILMLEIKDVVKTWENGILKEDKRGWKKNSGIFGKLQKIFIFFLVVKMKIIEL